MVKMPCRFSNRGCENRSSGESLLFHEKICEKSRVKCSKIVHACTESVELLTLVEHVQSRHRCPTTVGNSVLGVELWGPQDSEESCFWNYHHLQYNGNDFFTKIAYKESLVYFWVYMIGTDEETKDYGYRISLGSSSDNTDELSFKGKQVCSLFTSGSGLLEGNYGSSVLAMNRSTVKNLTKYNSNGRCVLEYKFEIIKKVCNLLVNRCKKTFLTKYVVV